MEIEIDWRPSSSKQVGDVTTHYSELVPKIVGPSVTTEVSDTPVLDLHGFPARMAMVLQRAATQSRDSSKWYGVKIKNEVCFVCLSGKVDGNLIRMVESDGGFYYFALHRVAASTVVDHLCSKTRVSGRCPITQLDD